MQESPAGDAQAKRADAQPDDGATGSIVVPPCKAAGGTGAAKAECSEQGAVRVAVCARVPAAASIKEVLL